MRSVAIIHYDSQAKTFLAIVPDGVGGVLEHPLVKITSGSATGGAGQVVISDGTDTMWDAAPAPPGSTASSVSVAFTDGDTVRRVSVADASIGSGDKVLVSIRRPNKSTDADDDGLIFLANVVNTYAGGFDAVIVCLDRGGMDPTETPPNETIALYYMVFP